MLVDIHEMTQRSNELKAQAQAILDETSGPGRSMSAEQRQQFDKLMDDADQLDADIERGIRAREAQRKAADIDPGRRDPAPDDDPAKTDAERKMSAFRAYLLGGVRTLSTEQRAALNASNDTEGGFLVAPQEFVQTLLKKVDDIAPFRGMATVYQLTQAESLGVPTLDNDLADADWTSELGTGNQDDSLRFGKRELRPHPLAKRVKISRKLMRASVINPESLVQDRMSYKFGVTQEKAFMTGDGNEKPLGVFTASSQGITTGRDVPIGTSGAIPLTTANGADNLIDAKYTLKAQYHANAMWMWHRDVLRTIRKIKDGQGQYVWKAGLSDGPDTILEIPYVLSEYAPNTVTANAYVGILGDFKFYWIAESLAMEVQRLNELYAETNQVGFIGRQETDGMPVLEEAFVRLKVAA